ncbi:MAG: leucine-rich repeat protein, partial [Lachnospiraceae bacterium]|nr:leucine-rich repeat protein [Lachnospiraceae bacterium]
CRVVTIGKSAFKGNTSITKIVMGKYVETIGTKAFAGLKNLNEISISSSKLSKVSKSAFAKISKDAKFYIKAKKSACKAIATLITKSGVKKVNYERVK